MQELETKMSEAKAKKDQLVARARVAKTTANVNDMLSGVGTGQSAMAAFDRMSEKVETLEAEADVSKQMAAANGSGTKALGMEEKFKALEQSSSVDDELESLRRSMLPPGADRPQIEGK
jgi:phage shock protein A